VIADAIGAPVDDFHLDCRRKVGKKMGMDAVSR
jgi:hypothetical protein